MARPRRTTAQKRSQAAIARILRAARADLGKSQAEVADELDVSQATVSDWESGKYSPTLFRARRVSDVYGVELDALLPKAA